MARHDSRTLQIHFAFETRTRSSPDLCRYPNRRRVGEILLLFQYFLSSILPRAVGSFAINALENRHQKRFSIFPAGVSFSPASNVIREASPVLGRKSFAVFASLRKTWRFSAFFDRPPPPPPSTSAPQPAHKLFRNSSESFTF